MLRKRFYLGSVIFILFCVNLKAQRNEISEILPVIGINQDEFYNILDCVIEYEKKCNYDTPKLTFEISISVDQEITYILINSVRNQKFRSGLEVGIFEYKESIFILSGEIDKKIFSYTTDKKDYTFEVFKDYYNDLETGEIIIREMEDNSSTYSYWHYKFIDGEFYKIQTNTNCE